LALDVVIIPVADANGVYRVDSRGVAERFGKRHDNVIRAIENLTKEDPEALLNFEEGYYQLKSTGSQNHKLYQMDRDGFSLLAMGFTGGEASKWKRAYIKAFNAMEAKLRMLTPIEQAEANLIGWKKSEAARIALECKIEAMKPDVEAINLFRATPGSLPLRHAAKELKMSPMAFCDWLYEMGWTHWHNGERRIAYQPIIDNGWLSHGPAVVIDRSDGRRERVTGVQVTAEGMIKLAALLKEEESKRSKLSNIIDGDNGYRHDETYGLGED
jgi:Rha family phage regulatory protein